MSQSCLRVGTGHFTAPDQNGAKQPWYWQKLEAYDNMAEKFKGYLAKCLTDKMAKQITGAEMDPTVIYEAFLNYGLDEGFTTSSTLR
mmetsp:Transcript_8489/g.11211  ORF Transcript_8489/g.11211 Transcript_8489/m.11211 type:complete len:87 (+) Transcript_8489:436-696(+)